MGTVCYRSGFADVSNGEYLGLPVAVKSLRVNDGDSPKSFKVFSMDLVYRRRSFHIAVVSRDHLLETFDPSKYLAFVRSFSVRGPTLFQHSHRVDAQWERCPVHEIQPKSKSFEIGETAHHFPELIQLTNNLSCVRSCLV